MSWVEDKIRPKTAGQVKALEQAREENALDTWPEEDGVWHVFRGPECWDVLLEMVDDDGNYADMSYPEALRTMSPEQVGTEKLFRLAEEAKREEEREARHQEYLAARQRIRDESEW